MHTSGARDPTMGSLREEKFMFTRNKLFASTAMLASVFLLGACGDSANESEQAEQGVAPIAPAPTNVAYISNEDGGISVLDLETMTFTKQFTAGERPRGLAVTGDGRHLLVANGKTNDMSVIDTITGEEAHRIDLGPNPEFLRVLGNTAYVTYEPGGRRTEEREDRDFENEPPAEIAVVDLTTWTMTRSVPSGLETEGLEFSPDGAYIITTNEGDETISVYERETGAEVKTISTREYGKRPRGIKAAPDGSGYVVTAETSSDLLLLDSDFNVVKSVKTKTGPNGVAYDPTGQYLLVTAARDGLLQMYDAKTLEVIKEVPIGRRCWHFTHTPDGSKIIVVCGRSHDLHVIDAQDFTPILTLPDLALPWGIVTYPSTHGSLDEPRSN
jgi:YVTN family beta-propeller protein